MGSGWGGGRRARARVLAKPRVAWESPGAAHQAVEGTVLIIIEGGGGGQRCSGEG